MRTIRSRLASIGGCAAALIALGVFATAGTAAQDEPKEINLVFNGNGSVLATQTTLVSNYDFKTRSRGIGTAQTTGRRPFSGSGYVEISGRSARIKLPNAMMPLLRGDNDGWFTIDDFFMNDREITGSVRINALNKPKLRIDRGSGSITLSGGMSDFSGQCDLIDSGAKRRF